MTMLHFISVSKAATIPTSVQLRHLYRHVLQSGTFNQRSPQTQVGCMESQSQMQNHLDSLFPFSHSEPAMHSSAASIRSSPIDDGNKPDSRSVQSAIRQLGISREETAELQGYIKRLLEEKADSGRGPIELLIVERFQKDWKIWEEEPLIKTKLAVKECVEALRRGMLLIHSPRPMSSPASGTAVRQDGSQERFAAASRLGYSRRRASVSPLTRDGSDSRSLPKDTQQFQSPGMSRSRHQGNPPPGNFSRTSRSDHGEISSAVGCAGGCRAINDIAASPNPPIASRWCDPRPAVSHPPHPTTGYRLNSQPMPAPSRLTQRPASWRSVSRRQSMILNDTPIEPPYASSVRPQIRVSDTAQNTARAVLPKPPMTRDSGTQTEEAPQRTHI
ncbi:hypothetical protein VTK56DRAFT_768 [Thermocarpiscus australiensis]